MDMFEEIVHRNRDELINFCILRMKYDESAAEDVVQEVFLTLYSKKSLDLHGNIRAWLFRTAENKIKEYYRHNPVHEGFPDTVELHDPTQDIESVGVLDMLSDEEKELVEEYYLYGEDKDKLADSHGLTLSGLYNRIKRIRKKISKVMSRSDK